MKSIFTSTKKDEIQSLAIGRFEGMHLGHFKLFKHLDEHSALLIIDKHSHFCLTTKAERKALLGIEQIYVDFELLKELDGKDFLKLLQKEFKNLKKIIVGEDFCFGKNRAFKARDIEKFSDFKLVLVKECKINGIAVHSSKIKEFLSLGELQKANEFLGRTYSIRGNLIKGQGLGSKELFATLNLDTQKQYFLPKNGVYASVTKIQNQSFKSVSFIGKRLSTDGNFSVESHIIEPNFKLKLLQNESLQVYFKAFLRTNKKFEHLTALKAQIAKDIEQALIILNKC